MCDSENVNLKRMGEINPGLDLSDETSATFFSRQSDNIPIRDDNNDEFPGQHSQNHPGATPMVLESDVNISTEARTEFQKHVNSNSDQDDDCTDSETSHETSPTQECPQGDHNNPSDSICQENEPTNSEPKTTASICVEKPMMTPGGQETASVMTELNNPSCVLDTNVANKSITQESRDNPLDRKVYLNGTQTDQHSVFFSNGIVEAADLGDGRRFFKWAGKYEMNHVNSDNTSPKIKSDTAPIVENEETRDGDVVRTPDTRTVQPDSAISNAAAYITVVTLLFINLLNYMDRFTIAGVLPSLQKYYNNIDNSEAGLIQTSFICTYMVFSPIFGYLGDRYTRKYIMAFGIFFWSLFTLSASFIPSDYFGAFVTLRAMVGIGEASYSTIAPTIIADLFAREKRTLMLMVFYFAIPVGSGLGYIVGAYVAKLLGSWQWALRVTPGLGVVCVILILIFCREPPRGHAEGGTHLVRTSYCQDLLMLVKNTSFMFSTAGFTCVAFVTGALAFWAPTYMVDSIKAQGREVDNAQVSLLFGIITVAAGFLGVGLGAETARRYKRINPRADPIICAFGLLTCVPFLFLGLVIARFNTPVTWMLIFLGETMLCMNWAVVTDILLYVVIPTRRSTAEAFQILVSHAFGDAGSPYLIGLVSDSLTTHFNGSPSSPAVKFVTLQYALYVTTFVCVIGGGFFLTTALFVERDRDKADRQIRGSVESSDDEGEIDEVEIVRSMEPFA